VEIECTKHEKDQKGVFVNLQKIRDEGEVMCTDGEEDHAITWDEISKILPWSPYSVSDVFTKLLTQVKFLFFFNLSKVTSVSVFSMRMKKMEIA
jgi:hypothetical protein